MHSDLREGGHNQRQGEGRPTIQLGVENVERRRGEQHRERKSDQIAANSLADGAMCGIHGSGRHVITAAIALVSHRAAPIRYTTVNSATQMMSRACQNRLKQISRRKILARKPLTKTCAIMVPSHSSPALTCRP